MDRRTFIGSLAGLLTAPLGAEAQQPAKVWRIGHLGHGFDPHLIETFRRELGERGYVEGKDIAMEFRYSEGQVERLPDWQLNSSASGSMSSSQMVLPPFRLQCESADGRR
jgi:putative ABC transport system substrate-binding protein